MGLQYIAKYCLLNLATESRLWVRYIMQRLSQTRRNGVITGMIGTHDMTQYETRREKMAADTIRQCSRGGRAGSLRRYTESMVDVSEQACEEVIQAHPSLPSPGTDRRGEELVAV
jgi:hypothetical protein